MTKTAKIEKIIKKLRDPDAGCPWDIKQTHTSLLPYLLEETYELIDAIKEKNKDNIKEELGDLLLQILLHTKIEDEKGNFNLQDVINILCEKLIRRHPHVFKKKERLTDEELNQQWKEIKNNEGKTENKEKTFESINKSQSALLKALEISKISKDLAFDWKDYNGPLLKVKEETREVEEEIKKNIENLDKIEEEIGDLLFSIINLSRHLKINPEIALQSANKKFIKRFNLMLEQFENKEKFKKSSDKLKEDTWNKIKKFTIT